MELKLERNGRIWNNGRRPEEVLDVFYGDDFKLKLPRGFCDEAYKLLIKEPLEKGEALIVDLKVLSKSSVA